MKLTADSRITDTLSKGLVLTVTPASASTVLVEMRQGNSAWSRQVVSAATIFGPFDADVEYICNLLSGSTAEVSESEYSFSLTEKQVVSNFNPVTGVIEIDPNDSRISIGSPTDEGFTFDVNGSARAKGISRTTQTIVGATDHAIVEMYNFHSGGIKASDHIGSLKFSGNAPVGGYESHGAYIQAVATADWTETSKPMNMMFSCRIPDAADSQRFAYSDDLGYLLVSTGFRAGPFFSSGSVGSGKCGVNVNTTAQLGVGLLTIDAYDYSVELLTFKARHQTTGTWGFYAYLTAAGFGVKFLDQAGVSAFCVDGNRRVGIGNANTAPMAQLHTTSFAKAIVSKSANYTLTLASDHAALCDATSGAFAVTLPAAATVSGIEYVIKKIDAGANAVTLTGIEAETIDGSNTYALTAQWQFVRVQSNGTAWFVVGKG